MNAAEEVPCLTDPTGREHPLTGESITIGRALENDIVITSKRVSREHARVRREGWRVILDDLGSTNGTFLNDERVLSSVELHDGDHITIGDVTLVFHDPDITYRDTPFPELEVDVAAGSVRVDRHLVGLAPKEFALLAYLCDAPKTTSGKPSGPSTTRVSMTIRSRTWYAACAPNSNPTPPIRNCCSPYVG